MSKLKAYCPYANRDGFYHKSEADKVIEELKAENKNLKDTLGGTNIAYKQCYDEYKQCDKELRHANYKRCLAMARWCESEENRLEAISPIFDTDRECWEYGSDYWNKWHKRWLKLAEEFK